MPEFLLGLPHLADGPLLAAARRLRLLDAETNEADWREVAQIVLHHDPVGKPNAHGPARKAISPARSG